MNVSLPVQRNGAPVESSDRPVPSQKASKLQFSAPPSSALPTRVTNISEPEQTLEKYPVEENRDEQLVEQSLSAPPLPMHETTPDAEKVKKRQSFITRTLWTFIMIGGFIGTYFTTLYALQDIEVTFSFVASWTYIYGPAGHALSNTCLPRSDGVVLSEIHETRIIRRRSYARQRSMEQNP